MTKAKITSKGQITLPKEIRDDLGLRAGDEVDFVLDGSTYRLRKVQGPNPFSAWRGFLKEFEGMTSDELIDEMRGDRLDNRD